MQQGNERGLESLTSFSLDTYTFDKDFESKIANYGVARIAHENLCTLKVTENSDIGTVTRIGHGKKSDRRGLVRHEKGVDDRFGLYDEAPKSKIEHEGGRKDAE
ncbi:hypothetical protein Tco_0077763 [Tanacetum coccineum]